METTTVNDPLVAEYLERHALYTGKDQKQPLSSAERDQFYERAYGLHQRFMAGEFSLGYMAQLLEITKSDLYHLLDSMRLKVTNV